MLRDLLRRVRTLAVRLRRAERRELREFRRWAETTDRLVHLSVLVFVPLLIGLVTLLSNAVPQLSFLLFPPLASGSYTLFVDPRGKYAEPGQFVAGLTIGAACGLGALWVSTALLTPPAGQFRVAAGAAVLATLATGLVTWPFDIEEPSAYSTALLALLVQPAQRWTFLGSIFLASAIVAVVFVVWRNRFYDRRATVLYESTTGDDHVLVPMRGDHAHATAMLGARLAAAHEAGKVVLLDIVDDTDAAAHAEVAVRVTEVPDERRLGERVFERVALVVDELAEFVRSVATGDELRELPAELVQHCFLAVLCQGVLVRPLVEFALLDQPHLDEVVEVGVESAVVDLVAVVGLEFSLDSESIPGFLCQDDEDVLLERGQVFCDTGTARYGLCL